jgi:cytochrome c oxidase subunit 4
MSAHTEHAGNPPRTYLLVLIALLILTAITVGVSYIDFGDGNIVVALLVATLKASLVGMFFMHLLHDKKINALIIVSSFLFLGILIGVCFMDQGSRDVYIPANAKPPAGGMPAKTEGPKEGAKTGEPVQKQ